MHPRGPEAWQSLVASGSNSPNGVSLLLSLYDKWLAGPPEDSLAITTLSSCKQKLFTVLTSSPEFFLDP